MGRSAASANGEKVPTAPDIPVQVAAANAALQRIYERAARNHIKTCVADDIRAENDEVITSLSPRCKADAMIFGDFYERKEEMEQYNVTGMSCAAQHLCGKSGQQGAGRYVLPSQPAQ